MRYHLYYVYLLKIATDNKCHFRFITNEIYRDFQEIKNVTWQFTIVIRQAPGWAMLHDW